MTLIEACGPDRPFSQEGLRPFLRTRYIGRGSVEFHDRIDSTNARIRALGLDGSAEGALVAADLQTAGRGRHGRNWHSPPGVNLYFSVLLRPNLPLAQMSLLTLAAGVGAARAVDRATGCRTGIKWPNDLEIGGRKVAGLLTELELRNGAPQFAVLGVGLNVNLAAADLPRDLTDRAGSLLTATGRRWDRMELLGAMLEELEDQYEDLRGGRADLVLARHRRASVTLGAVVRVTLADGIFEGDAEAVDEDGALTIRRRSDGRTIRVSAGEVSLVRPTGTRPD